MKTQGGLKRWIASLEEGVRGQLQAVISVSLPFQALPVMPPPWSSGQRGLGQSEPWTGGMRVSFFWGGW